MNRSSRLLNTVYGIGYIVAAFLLVINPDVGFMAIVISMGVIVLNRGIEKFINYFLLLRHMVGGQKTLYESVIEMDFGLFMLLLVERTRLLIVFYLVGMLLLNGVIDLLRFIELVRIRNRYWFWHLVRCLLELTVSLLCVVFYQNYRISACLYAIWMTNAGVEKIIDCVKVKKVVTISQ